MTFRSLVLLVSLTATSVGTLTARADAPTATCSYTSTSTSEFLVDLRTGETVGSRRYKLSDQVRIILQNKNPFAFDYRVTVQEKAVEEPALAAFLTLSGLQQVLAPEDTSGNDQQQNVPPAAEAARRPPQPPPESPETLSPGREDIEKELWNRGIPQQADELDSTARDLKDKKKALDQAVKDLQETVASLQKKLADPNSDCATLILTAEALRQALSARDIGDRRKEIVQGQTQYRDLIGAQRRALERLTQDLLRDKVKTDLVNEVLGPYRDRFNVHADLIWPPLATTLSTSDSVLKGMSKSKEALEKVLAEPNAFLESVATVGDHHLPTNVTLTVHRKAKDAKEFSTSAFVEKTLNFGGGQRFILAVGLTYSGLDKTRFNAVQGFQTDVDGNRVPGDDGKDNFTRVVGLEEQSDNRVTPMLALHTRVGKCFSWCDGTYLTLGLNGNFNNDGDTVEILAGVSFSFAEERFFVTIGGYYGRQHALADDLRLGDALPTDVTEVPTRKEGAWDLGIALSYKIK